MSGEMAAMIQRGRSALEAFLHQAYSPGEVPTGYTDMAVVTREDYGENPFLVLDHAIHHQSVNILYHDGSIVALMCRHGMTRAGG